jgi:NitT/TauT family transport system permease protein
MDERPEGPMFHALWSGSSQFPGIEQIGKAFIELATNGVLYRYSVASLFRVTLGFYIAVLLAVPLGLLLGRIQRLSRIMNPFIQFLRPISPLAWVPFAMVWFGIGDKPAFFIIFLAAFFPILISAMEASASIHPMYFQVGANLQLNPLESFCYIVLPAATPHIILALRVSLGVAWMVVVAAEMIAVKSGLGYLIIDARNALRLDYVVVAMITIGIIGLLLDQAISRLGRLETVRWRLERK